MSPEQTAECAAYCYEVSKKGDNRLGSEGWAETFQAKGQKMTFKAEGYHIVQNLKLNETTDVGWEEWDNRTKLLSDLSASHR